MTRRAISTNEAPGAIGPYSQAIAVDGFLFCSGQLGLDPATIIKLASNENPWGPSPRAVEA